jgi:hypothetical protein
MIPSPFWFEGKLTPEDYQKLGKLSLRWSHIDHLIANCLKKLLRLTDDEARLVGLSTQHGYSIGAHARSPRIEPSADTGGQTSL